jgi:tetratricopeptide (TPR) repeat protein
MTLEGGDEGHRIDTDQELAQLSHHRLAFPTEPRGYGEAIDLLCSLGRKAEAEAISSAAIMNVSGDPWTWFRHASVARQRGDLTQALDRIRATTEKFPDFQVGWFVTIEILRDLRRYEEAEAVLAHYLQSGRTLRPPRASELSWHKHAATGRRRWLTLPTIAPHSRPSPPRMARPSTCSVDSAEAPMLKR